MIAVLAARFHFQPTELLNFTDEDLEWWFDRLMDYVGLIDLFSSTGTDYGSPINFY